MELTPKSLIAISAACSGLAFFLGIVVVEATSFTATGEGMDLSASMQELRMGDRYTSIWDFCHADDSTCHADKCENIEDTFCNIHVASIVISGLSELFCALHTIIMLGVALGYTHLCMTPPHKAKGLANCTVLMMCVASLFWVIMLPLWGSAKGKLPDLHCTVRNPTTQACLAPVDFEWLYVPGASVEDLKWSFGAAWVTLFFGAILAVVSAVTGWLGAVRMHDTASMEETPIVAAIGHGAGTGESLIQGGKSDGPNDGSFTEYNDSTL